MLASYRRFAAIALAFVALFCSSYWLSFQQLLQLSQQTAMQQGTEFNQYLDQQLDRFSQLTGALVRRPELLPVLQAPDDTVKQQQLSQLLADFNLASGSASIYLMDLSGVVLASSNYHEAVSFMHYNFGFRPYFTETVRTGESYVDYGLGWISNERGIYFASLVLAGDKPLGVLTVKLNIDRVEQAYQAIAGQSPLLFMLVDDEDSVIGSNHAPWRLSQLGDKALTLPRHPGVVLPALHVRQRGMLWKLLVEPDSADPMPREFAVAVKQNQRLPWQLLMLQAAQPLRVQALQLAASLSLLLGMLVLLGGYWRNRRQQLRQRERIFAQLEQAVTERTESLTLSNQQLQHEITQRYEAEAELKQAQQQLLQAAKLATIGQLSASINHEINQPLTAMHSYLQNTRLLLQKGRVDELSANLDKLSQLLLRLNHIVKQFKSFSRKAANNPESVPLHQVVHNALGIVQPALKQQQVQVRLKENHVARVRLDPLQLEQVLVNLIGNAAQAMEQTPQPELVIQLDATEAQVQVSIQDKGPGIQPHDMVHLFEPFFTTKQGSGLGLGLSISRQIVESYGGTLSIDNHPDGGAIVILSLPRDPSET